VAAKNKNRFWTWEKLTQSVQSIWNQKVNSFSRKPPFCLDWLNH